MAKYEEVAGALVRYINENELNADDKLPSIQEMVDYYQVSKNTVLSALNDLEKQGLIYQVRGSGVYVPRPMRSRSCERRGGCMPCASAGWCATSSRADSPTTCCTSWAPSISTRCTTPKADAAADNPRHRPVDDGHDTCRVVQMSSQVPSPRLRALPGRRR